jgi:hypothetical protein
MWAAALTLPGVSEDRAEVVGDVWSAMCPRVALGLHDVNAGGDPVAVERVGPFEAVELGPAQAGVDGRSRRGGGLRARGRRPGARPPQARLRQHARLLFVRLELNEGTWITLDEPALGAAAQTQMPKASETSCAIDERERPARASCPIQRGQSFGQLAGEAVPSSGRRLYSSGDPDTRIMMADILDEVRGLQAIWSHERGHIRACAPRKTLSRGRSCRR